MNLYIKEIKGKGRGVFSEQAIDQDEVIEICPVILVSNQDEKFLLDQTILSDYFFSWNEETSVSAIALGYGCLYNHSVKANAGYVMDREENVIRFYSLRRIEADEEITINYNGSPDATGLEWFERRNIRYVEAMSNKK